MGEAQGSVYGNLVGLLRALDERKIHFELGSHREGVVMVKVAVPGERWEIEFFEDGGVDVEVFVASAMGIEGEAAIDRLLRENLD